MHKDKMEKAYPYNPEDAFVKKGWIPTDKGLWRKVKSTEAYVTIYPENVDDDAPLYEFSIYDPRGISWKNSRKVLKEMEDLLPIGDSPEPVSSFPHA
ncbi:MAG: hypothetical protein BAA01_08675 [Bacillus thermozeamaize]|uniref:Uncharacterized protein n=1 Tax=Bacillus thermozeamaize TaxID=230954 RepID=A0A1Y3PM69_9BACI|nr:MAG: hypothetical protein BAA01_08675 [Bacillus thermozeamaize]